LGKLEGEALDRFGQRLTHPFDRPALAA